MSERKNIRVGVVFGGRSGEHEVSLASARNVMDALDQAGYTVTPIGITPQGRWLTGGNPHKLLEEQAAGTGAPERLLAQMAENGVGHHPSGDEDGWAMLPQSTKERPMPAIDVVFPVLHGTYGEDGTIQGMFEMANMAYVGSGVLGSAVSMDKAVARQLFAAEGLRQTRWQVVLRRSWQNEPERARKAVERTLRYPLFVKPANLGSSIGVSKAHDPSELKPALDLALEYDRKALVEEAVPNVREIEVSVLGNDEPVASVPGEIVPGAEFYSYEAKYLDDNSTLLIPAPISDEHAEQVRAMAVQAFRAVDGCGLARVDFLMDGGSGEIYLNEINTMPGFTRISMYPKLWEASGVSYAELVDKLVQLALERHEERQQNRTTR
jgi:D-alanine-D-alanine ligase